MVKMRRSSGRRMALWQGPAISVGLCPNGNSLVRGLTLL